MKSCSVCKGLKIVSGCLTDYKQLARYHYLGDHPGPASAIFVLSRSGSKIPVGVIVYSNAPAVLELRNVAINYVFTGLDKNTQIGLINKNIRRISRVIIEPRFRGLGLASRLVRETMPLVNIPIVEALAVMGWINPFLERAGMNAYKAPSPSATVQFVEALSIVGVEQADLINPERVQHKFERLDNCQASFMENQIHHFLKSHGRRREMPPGIERTRYILSKLAARPVYYIWFNPKLIKEDQSCVKLV